MVRRFNRLMLLLIPSAWLMAQPETATLRGRITDPGGAPVAGIHLVLFEGGKDLSVRDVASGAGGHYTAPLLKPGKYTLRIDAAHYQNFQVDNITLAAGQVQYFDVELKPETHDETVMQDETGKPALPNNSATAGLVDFKRQWQDTPYIDLHPSLLPLLTGAPAAQGTGSGTTAGLVIAGIASRNQQSWGIDGVAQDSTPQTLNPAFVETAQVTFAGAGIDSAKAVRVQALSKHGTDSFHGMLSYKRASSAFASKEYFETSKARFKVSEAQGEVSGAIIPHRTFFYAGAMYQKTPYGETMYADVPTDQMRKLDFTQFLNAQTAPNGKIVIVRDPKNGSPFPNNTIPTSRINLVASHFLSTYYPSANLGTADTFTRNYTWLHPDGSDSYVGNWPFGRVDQRINANNQLYFHWMQNQTATIAPGSVGELLNATRTNRYRGYTVSEASALSTSLSNQFTVSHTGILNSGGEAENKLNPLTGNTVVGNVGLLGVNPNAFATQGFPSVAISGLTGLSMAFGGGDHKSYTARDSINTVQETLIWSKGQHSLKFGWQYQSYHWMNGEVPQDVYGAFTFTGMFTGLGFADFALGFPSTSTRQSGRVDRTLHQTQTGLFLGDTFRVNRRFTLDFGVRWDYYSTPVYDDGYMANWNPATGQVIVPPGTLTAVSTFFPKGATVVVGQVVPKSKTTNFRPRVGGAYRLTDNFVLRGGYGEYTENEGYGTSGRLSANNPFSLTETYTNSITGTAVALSFPKPFPTTPSSSQLPGQDITALPAKTVEGVIRQFNATLEGMLHGFAVQAGYVGSRGANMNYTLDVNKPQASATALTNTRKPFPLWASAFETRTDGKWKYDSAVAGVQRATGPVTFHANFTWGKNTSNYANTTDPYNVTNTWTTDASDRQKYFSTGATLAIPAGKGHALAGQVGPIMNYLVSGWQLQLIGTVASGQYYSPLFTGADPANASAGFVTQLPDCVGDPNSGARTLARWFNPSAFAVPSATAGRYGTCGMNTLEGYPIHIAHGSVGKVFAFGEALKLAFTAQIANVTNTPHFTIPNNNISTPNAGIFTAASLGTNSMPERLGSRQVDFKVRVVW